MPRQIMWNGTCFPSMARPSGVLGNSAGPPGPRSRRRPTVSQREVGDSTIEIRYREVIKNGSEEEGRQEEGRQEEGRQEEEVVRSGPGTSSGDWSAMPTNPQSLKDGVSLGLEALR